MPKLVKKTTTITEEFLDPELTEAELDELEEEEEEDAEGDEPEAESAPTADKRRRRK